MIGAVLVWLAPRAASIAWLALVCGAVALGLLTALPVADDPVFPFWALIPCPHRPADGLAELGPATGHAAAFAFITILVAVLGGALIDHIMRSNGVTSTSFPFTFLTPGSIVNNVELLFEGYMTLGGGYFFGDRPGFLGYLIFASGALLLAAVFLGLVEVRRLASIAGPRPESGERPSPRLAYIGFWAFSLLVQSACSSAAASGGHPQLPLRTGRLCRDHRAGAAACDAQPRLAVGGRGRSVRVRLQLHLPAGASALRARKCLPVPRCWKRTPAVRAGT